MIKAIIFDCFGVLVEESLGPFYRIYLHGDTELIGKAEADMVLSNKGLITYKEFTKRVAKLAKIEPQAAEDFLNINPVNESLIEYIKTELKPQYKIGFLSNASANWLNDLFTTEQLDLFEARVLSYDVGFAKPEAEAYELVADKLGVRLDECVFTDDREEYTNGAIAVGMQAIVFTSTEEFKKDLGVILKK